MAEGKGELLIEFGPAYGILKGLLAACTAYGPAIREQAAGCTARESGLEEYALEPWLLDCEHLAECFDDLAKAARHTLSALERLGLKYPDREG